MKEKLRFVRLIAQGAGDGKKFYDIIADETTGVAQIWTANGRLKGRPGDDQGGCLRDRGKYDCEEDAMRVFYSLMDQKMTGGYDPVTVRTRTELSTDLLVSTYDTKISINKKIENLRPEPYTYKGQEISKSKLLISHLSVSEEYLEEIELMEGMEFE